jgi:hypothetical protein
MTNYFYQNLLISGEKEDLAPFAKKLLASWQNYKDEPTKGQYQLLRTFVPIPDDIYDGSASLGVLLEVCELICKGDDIDKFATKWTKEQVATAKEKYGKYGWFWSLWFTEHWGNFSADLHTTMDEHDDTHIHLSFESALAPIIEGILHISNNYPLLTFSLNFTDDQDLYHLGRVEIKGGEVLSQWEDTVEFNESFDESKYNPAGSICSNIEDNSDVF